MQLATSSLLFSIIYTLTREFWKSGFGIVRDADFAAMSLKSLHLLALKPAG